MILVNYEQHKKINMKCVDIHCLHIVHLIKKKNVIDYYRGKDCLKRVCKDLRKQARSIVDCEKKRIDKINRRRKF